MPNRRKYKRGDKQPGLLPDGQTLQIIASHLEPLMNGHGFCLLVFPFRNDKAYGNYISNANRKDMVEHLRKTADRLEKGEDFPTPSNR